MELQEHFSNPATMFSDLGQMFQPPKRMEVAKAVEENVMIATPGGYAGPWSGSTTPYMVEPMNLLTSREHHSIIFAGPARTGKALDINTPIPTPDGWKPLWFIEEGDFVLGDDGEPVEVDLATDHMYDHECYEVEFSDGEVIVADAEHLWTVQQFNRDGTVKKSKPVATKSTLELLKNYKLHKNGKNRYLYAIENTKPLNLSEKYLPIDPYVLGVWLGDGDSTSSRITTSKDDLEIKKYLEDAGHVVEISGVDKRNENVVYLHVDPKPIEGDICFRGHDKRVTGEYSNGTCAECGRQNHKYRKHGIEPDPPINKHKGLSWNLRELGILSDKGNDKKIPPIYLRGSHNQRLALLQGLMDTDGCCDTRQGQSSFASTNINLSLGVYELLMSFGVRATIRKRVTNAVNNGIKVPGRPSWTVDFHVYDDFPLFRLSRKLKKLRPAPKKRDKENKRRRIVRIEKTSSRPVKCIRVKNESHLYLAGRGMIPTHNTQGLIDGGIGYIVSCDPSDALVVHMTEEAARRYSRMRVKRMLNNSPSLKKQLSPISHDDNVLGKYFKNGTALILAWPSPTQLSAQDYKYVFQSDYDRMPDDTGEGDVYTLGLKRTQTFMSAGMCVVESSPGRDFIETSWKPKTIHDAPSVGGILGLYNTGDKRLWFWSCPDCDESFGLRPGLDLFHLPSRRELVEKIAKDGVKGVARRYSSIACPHCGCILEHRHKNEMNLKGFWKKEKDQENNIASFWLSGVAAKFQTWESLLEKEFNAIMHFEQTGEEEKLKATRNTDQGIPYVPVGAAEKLTAEELEARAEDLPQKQVPEGVRFLIASIDVQAHKFVVHVEGRGMGNELWVIDRFDIAISERESHGELMPLDPAGHKEDWDLIIKRVIQKRYPLADKSGRDMGIIMTVCDSGGKEGVTENAYHFWKKMKKEFMHDRFNLIKGERPRPTVNKAMVSKKVIDKSSKAGRKANVTGELPLWLLNTTMLKDAVASNLKRKDIGNDYIHFPNWLSLWYYSEIVAETRTEKGWENLSSQRNEQFDLFCYAKAAYLIKMDNYWKSEINWDAPPAWAEEWDNNSEVSHPEDKTKSKTDATPKSSRTRVRMKVRR